jgi:lysozyme
MRIVPRSRPQITRDECLCVMASHGLVAIPALVGIRGYYLDSMGVPGENDRGLYDDAIILVHDGGYRAFNANTDPSIGRKGIAVLMPGVWWYKLGIHGLSRPKSRRYEALVQADEVRVTRDEEGESRGFIGLNIHRGATHGTSSLGCQTIHPSQWTNFIDLVREEMAKAGVKRIPYLLICEEERHPKPAAA